jgi:hypothetical protein
MGNSFHALPVPSPEPDPENVPTLVPAPVAAAGRSPSALNKGQLREITKAELYALVAQKYAEAMAHQKITAQFTGTLLSDIEEARAKSSGAVDATSRAEADTDAVQASMQKLIQALRQVQAAARKEFRNSNPSKLNAYYIGERIDANREILEECAQGILANAGVDRPGAVNTEFVVRAEAARSAYTQSKLAKVSGQSQAKTKRLERNAAVASIVQRRREIQFAADAQWPPNVPEHAAVRAEFGLSPNRPFTA